MKKQAVLVTGINGFLGSHILTELIQQGYDDIRGMVRKDADLSLISTHLDRITLMEGDISDVVFLNDALNNISHVIHCAGLVSYDPKMTDQLYKVNGEGTANVVNCSLENKVAKLVYISSIAAVGKKREGDLLDEDSTWQADSKANTNYARSKYMGEMEAWRGNYEGLSTTIVCPSLILGNGDFDRSSVNLTKRIFHHSKYYPTGSTGIVDVKDVAKAAVLAIDDTFNGRKYIVSALNISYHSLFDKIATGLQVNLPSKGISPWLGKAGVVLEILISRWRGRRPLLTFETLNSTSFRSLYDNTRSIKELGMVYRDTDQTIADMTSSFLKQAIKA